MARSSWKLPYISSLFFQRRFLNNLNSNVRLRNSVVPYIFIERKLKLNIYNGI